MAKIRKPIALLADSQPLFFEHQGRRFLAALRDHLESPRPRAAYLGASNGDRPEFFELFQGAMAGVGVEDSRSIPSRPSAEDVDYFEAADLVFLAGGDPLRGWRAFESSGLSLRIAEKHAAGALIVGLSAGAMLLGLYGVGEESAVPFEALGLVPFVVDAHDEPGWGRLRRLLETLGPSVRGLGIPTGGAVLVHSDRSLEAIRHPFSEVFS